MKYSCLSVLVIASLSLLPAYPATIVASFSSDPTLNNWQAAGERDLFVWDSEQRNLRVTWDSSRSNSFFSHSLGTILTRDDDFEFSFDLWLDDVGPANEYLWSFQLAVGFLNLEQATEPGFLRGSGFESPNVVEVAYFRADDFGNPATVFPTFISTNAQFNYNPGQQNSTNYVLTTGEWHGVTMTYNAADAEAILSVTNHAGTSSVTLVQPLNETFTDYRVSAISISSYNHSGQFPGYEGSLLAHGRIDNIRVVIPPPPVGELSGGWTGQGWEVTFTSRSKWRYILQRGLTSDDWTDVSAAVEGTGAVLTLEDATPPTERAFYRVRAERP